MIYTAHVLVILSILSNELINGFPTKYCINRGEYEQLDFNGEYAYASLVAGQPWYSNGNVGRQLYNDGQKWIIYDRNIGSNVAECNNVINNERPDLSDTYCQSWKFAANDNRHEIIVSTTSNDYGVSFEACGDEHEESFHCNTYSTRDCNSCLPEKCGYDCHTAITYSVVCNACQDQCAAGLNAQYSGGSLKWVKDSAVTDECTYTPTRDLSLNRCMKYMKADSVNNAVFVQCDASTDYKQVWKQYSGLAFCDETPTKIVTSDDTCTSTSTGCNEKLVFEGTGDVGHNNNSPYIFIGGTDYMFVLLALGCIIGSCITFCIVYIISKYYHNKQNIASLSQQTLENVKINAQIDSENEDQQLIN